MFIRWGRVEAGMQFLWMLGGAGDAKSGHWSGQKLSYRARSWVSMATAAHGSHHKAQRASKATLNSCLLVICFVLCVAGFFFSFLLNKKAASSTIHVLLEMAGRWSGSVLGGGRAALGQVSWQR